MCEYKNKAFTAPAPATQSLLLVGLLLHPSVYHKFNCTSTLIHCTSALVHCTSTLCTTSSIARALLLHVRCCWNLHCVCFPFCVCNPFIMCARPLHCLRTLMWHDLGCPLKASHKYTEAVAGNGSCRRRRHDQLYDVRNNTAVASLC